MSFIQKIKKFFIFYQTYKKGMNREFAGEYDKAVKEFLFAVSLDYNNLEVYKALIRLCRKNKKYQPALDYAKTAYEKFPDVAFLHAQSADLERITGNPETAIEEYDKALKLDDKCIDYYRYRAQLKFSAGDIRGALTDYNGALIREKKNAELYSMRAFYQFELKNYESAVEDYTKAIKLKPNKAHYYYMRACAYKLSDNSGSYDEDMKKYTVLSKT